MPARPSGRHRAGVRSGSSDNLRARAKPVQRPTDTDRRATTPANARSERNGSHRPAVRLFGAPTDVRARSGGNVVRRDGGRRLARGGRPLACGRRLLAAAVAYWQ